MGNIVPAKGYKGLASHREHRHTNGSSVPCLVVEFMTKLGEENDFSQNQVFGHLIARKWRCEQWHYLWHHTNVVDMNENLTPLSEELTMIETSFIKRTN